MLQGQYYANTISWFCCVLLCLSGPNTEQFLHTHSPLHLKRILKLIKQSICSYIGET